MKPASVIFVSKEGLATFFFLVAAAVVVGSGFYAFRQSVTAGLRPQFIIMTNRDVHTMAPELDKAAMTEIHLSQTRLAMDSIFNKSPSGLDAKDRCQRLLNDATWDQVRSELVDKQAETFRKDHLHQKVEIGSIELRNLQSPPDATMAAVRGQLIRVGVQDFKLFNEVWEVRAQFIWVPSRNLQTSGRQPTVCTKFTCREVLLTTTLPRTGADTPPPPPSTETPASASN